MSEITGRVKAAIADRYKIEGELGAGGMATVYLAHDVKHDRKVALKVLRPELAAVIGAERFLQEIKVTANLQHSHILPLYDSGAAEGFLFYVMPYVEGETLRTKLTKEKQLGVDEAVAMTRAIAAALEHAHKQGVIHRDIKPENILLREGDPLIADFGIALALSHAGGSRLTETGLSIGTPHYMSPEQAMGDRELDARSDVYSLGAMLFEMLIGDPPYQGSTAQAIVAKVITEKAPPVTMLRDTVPAHVSAAVGKALNKLPADRFTSAASFAEALVTPGYVTPTRTGVAAPPGPRARDWRMMGLAAGLVLMTAAAAWALLRPAPAATPNYLRVALASHPIPPGLVGRDLALSPDGGTIVFSDTVGGTRQLWIKRSDRAEAEALTGTVGGRAPTFSPDGRWIAFVAEGRLRKVPSVGGSPITLADSAEWETGPAVAWLDNATIAYVGSQAGLRIVGEEGGPTRRHEYFTSLSMAVVTLGSAPGGAVFVGLCPFGCPYALLAVADPATGVLDTLAEEALRGWHVEGGRIVFVRRDGGAFVAQYDAAKRALASTPAPALDGVQTIRGSADIAVAANGTLLYVPGAATGGSSPAELVWVNRAGVAVPVDSGWTIVPSSNGGMRLSPDGRRVALSVQASGNEDIWIKQLERGAFTRLTFDGINIRPEWTADGRHVLYFSTRSGSGTLSGGNSNLYRRRADGTGGEELVLDAERPLWEVQQPRDTSLLIIRFGVPPSRDIYLYDRSGSSGDSIRPLVATDAHEETSIQLSPDGRWLAHASNESGRYEIYVRPFPDVDAGRWQISRDGGNEARWASSGDELYYRSAEGSLMAVPVQTSGASLVAGTPRALFHAGRFLSNTAYTGYEVVPDGRFLFMRFLASEAETLLANTAILVQNWLAELDARGVGSR